VARRLPLPKSGIASNGIKYAVKYDRDWQEWQGRGYKRSAKTGVWKFAEGPTCYCGDREEAISTFHHLVGFAPGYTRANPGLKSVLVRIGKKLYRAILRRRPRKER
jgi:hypothetical protein